MRGGKLRRRQPGRVRRSEERRGGEERGSPCGRVPETRAGESGGVGGRRSLHAAVFVAGGELRRWSVSGVRRRGFVTCRGDVRSADGSVQEPRGGERDGVR